MCTYVETRHDSKPYESTGSLTIKQAYRSARNKDVIVEQHVISGSYESADTTVVVQVREKKIGVAHLTRVSPLLLNELLTHKKMEDLWCDRGSIGSS